MTYQGFIKKCRTYDLAAIIAVLTVAQSFIPQFQLTQNQVAMGGMIISALIAFFRKITTGPVGEK